MHPLMAVIAFYSLLVDFNWFITFYAGVFPVRHRFNRPRIKLKVDLDGNNLGNTSGHG